MYKLVDTLSDIEYIIPPVLHVHDFFIYSLYTRSRPVARVNVELIPSVEAIVNDQVDPACNGITNNW